MDATFAQEFLDAHNKYRDKHGAPHLVLNKDISKISQEYANRLMGKGYLEYSGNKKFGENLYCTKGRITGKHPVDAWYSDIKEYKFGSEDELIILEARHFTQLVWQNTKEVGVGLARNGKWVVVVANYYPPGNIRHQFSEQVKPARVLVKQRTSSFRVANRRRSPKMNVTFRITPNKCREDGSEGNFQNDFLCTHNMYRKQHGVPPLSFEKKLNDLAQEWANHLASKHTVLEHRPYSVYGENLYCVQSVDMGYTLTGNVPVDSWYEEIHKHSFEEEPVDSSTGNFTQLVWKATKYLGVGIAKNSFGMIFVVGNYAPPGNFRGHFLENVPPPIVKINK